MLPAWLASTTQVPTPVKLTAPVAGAYEHAPAVLEASMLKLTGKPEVAVAEGV